MDFEAWGSTSTKMCKKITDPLFQWLRFSLTPPRILFELFESRRNKLHTPSGLRNVGTNFGFYFAFFFGYFTSVFNQFLTEMAENKMQNRNKSLYQRSEAPVGYGAYSFEIQKVQTISWGGVKENRSHWKSGTVIFLHIFVEVLIFFDFPCF